MFRWSLIVCLCVCLFVEADLRGCCPPPSSCASPPGLVHLLSPACTMSPDWHRWRRSESSFPRSSRVSCTPSVDWTGTWTGEPGGPAPVCGAEVRTRVFSKVLSGIGMFFRSVDRTQFQLFHPSLEDMVRAEKLFSSSPSHRVDYYASAVRMDHAPPLKEPEVSQTAHAPPAITWSDELCDHCCCDVLISFNRRPQVEADVLWSLLKSVCWFGSGVFHRPQQRGEVFPHQSSVLPDPGAGSPSVQNPGECCSSTPRVCSVWGGRSLPQLDVGVTQLVENALSHGLTTVCYNLTQLTAEFQRLQGLCRLVLMVCLWAEGDSVEFKSDLTVLATAVISSGIQVEDSSCCATSRFCLLFVQVNLNIGWRWKTNQLSCWNKVFPCASQVRSCVLSSFRVTRRRWTSSGWAELSPSSTCRDTDTERPETL